MVEVQRIEFSDKNQEFNGQSLGFEISVGGKFRFAWFCRLRVLEFVLLECSV